MTRRFHIEIIFRGQRWCDISIESRCADEILTDVRARFPEVEGYVHRVFLEEEARRLVEVTDQARVIGVTYSRTPHPMPEAFAPGADRP